MRIYFLPASEVALKDEVFKDSDYRGGVSSFPIWSRMRDAAERMGIEVHTYDFWRKEKAGESDILFVQNHPGETWPWRLLYYLKHWRAGGGFMIKRRKWFFENYKFFKRRVLAQCESPMVVPYVYKNFEKMKRSGLYHQIFLFTHYFDYIGKDFISPLFDAPKNKFLVMVNANAMPHRLRNEFYGERLKAIKYFSNAPDFDLYGHRWDRAPRHPFYFHYGKYVRKAWRRTTPDKMKTLSEYKFALCFENCADPGYISEKIFDCLAVGSIPIYLGAPDIESVVPKSCFIDFREFSGYPELDRFLRGLSEERLKEYREAILRFGEDVSRRKTMEDFVREIVG